MPYRPQGDAGIGSRIRRIRQAQDMTAQELAKSAGISAGYLSEVERDLSAISGEKLVRIAGALGVSVGMVVGEEEPVEDSHEIRIPQALSEAAEQLGISHRATISLLRGRRSLVAKRSQAPADEWKSADWLRFYRTVRKYLGDEAER